MPSKKYFPAMMAAPPSLSENNIRLLLEEVEKEHPGIPRPQEIRVEAGEDHDGDPVLFMTIVFAPELSPESLPWEKIYPLVDKFRSWIFEKDGEQRSVIAEIERLGDLTGEEIDE